MTVYRTNVFHPPKVLMLAFAFAFGLTACGGGGSTTPSGSTAPSAFQLVNAPITFKVHVVAAMDTTSSTTRSPSSSRSPQYISTAVASVVFVLTAVSPTTGTYTGSLPGTPTIIPVTSTTNGCTGTPGNYTCILTSTAPAPATDTWTIYTYATATPTVGTTIPLSIYVAYPLPVTVGGPNNATVATWGVPNTLAFSPAASTGPANVALTLTTALVVKDVGGAVLLGGNNFSNSTGTAGVVAFSGCGTHLTPTPATISAANPTALGAASISIAYDGLASAGTIVCSATAPDLTATYTVTLTAGTGSVGWTVTDSRRQ
jgi:hypothetical protein